MNIKELARERFLLDHKNRLSPQDRARIREIDRQMAVLRGTSGPEQEITPIPKEYTLSETLKRIGALGRK